MTKWVGVVQHSASRAVVFVSVPSLQICILGLEKYVGAIKCDVKSENWGVCVSVRPFRSRALLIP